MNNNWSLIPLTKILNAHSQLSRILWTIFSVAMVVGLVSSIILTVHQYLDQSTVFRMDYSTANYLNDLPAITVCHNNHRINKDVYHSIIGESTIIYNITPHSTANWSTENALSPLYRQFKNYTVEFRTDPVLKLILNVVEQFPRPKNQICTIFELYLEKSEAWNSLKITMEQPDPNPTDFFEVVIHGKESFPFNNYEKYLYKKVDPGKCIYTFTAKSVANHLDTNRNPCENIKINVMGRNFSYDQTVCQWMHVCVNLHKFCNCSCELDVLGVIHSRCSDKCLQKFSRALVNTSICPQACHKMKYSDLNVVTRDLSQYNKSEIEIIMSNLVSMATEEPIYTLAKMFSEIGGLSSLLFGVSCIIIFELLEKLLHSLSFVKSTKQPKRKRQEIHENSNQRSLQTECTFCDINIGQYYPIDVMIDNSSYSSLLFDCSFSIASVNFI